MITEEEKKNLQKFREYALYCMRNEFTDFQIDALKVMIDYVVCSAFSTHMANEHRNERAQEDKSGADAQP